MSVKRITLVALFLIIGGAFTYIGIADAVKTKDSLDFQQVELKSRSSEIQQLNVKYEKLNTDLDKASKEKEVNQQEVQRLEQEKQDLEKQKRDLEAQLQAKLEQKSQMALASTRAINAATGTQTASAMSGGSLESVIRSEAASRGLSGDYMVRVAMCESTMDPTAQNTGYYAGGGHPTGLYQYLPETWNRISSRSPYGTQAWGSVTDGVLNAKITVWAFANGYSGEWACA